MWEYNHTTELHHYGILGMKWGVRRFQKKDGTLTSEGKKRYDNDGDLNSDNPHEKKTLTTKQKIAIGAVAATGALVVIGGMYLYKKNKNHFSGYKTMKYGTKVDLDSLSTKETTLGVGTKFFRMSSKSVEEYTEEGRAYVSHLKKDRAIYKMTMPGLFKQWDQRGIIDDGRTAYEHVMSSNKEIKIPSKRTMAEIYMQVTKSNDVDDGHYKRFMTNLNNDKNPEVKDFYKKLRELGYNAVIDENDAGYLSKSPLILLNPKNDISSSKSHKVTKLENILSTILM